MDDAQKNRISEALLRHHIATICPTLSDCIDLKLDRDDTNELIYHYFHLFAGISQLICKNIAKQWIKIIDPRKQTTHPYKLPRKPSWWPASVPHVEPDHLLKFQRIELLTSIIRNPSFSLIGIRENSTMTTFGPRVNRLFEEIFYIAAYDRLFYNGLVDQDSISSLLLTTDRLVLKSSKIYLTVSNISMTKFDLKLRDMTPGIINYRVFLVRASLPPVVDLSFHYQSDNHMTNGWVLPYILKQKLHVRTDADSADTGSEVEQLDQEIDYVDFNDEEIRNSSPDTSQSHGELH